MLREHKFEVILSKTAFKYYKRVDMRTAKRLDKSFDILERDPYGGKGGDIKPLQGAGKFRLRVGDLRVTFTVNIREQKIEIEAILPRGGVYKR